MRTLIAIDPCIMKGTGKPALTVGKEYTTYYEDDHHVSIIDDKGEKHDYTLVSLDTFFDDQTQIKETNT